MPLDLNGGRGEIRAGGRWAATLSEIACHISPTDAMSASGRIEKRDGYLLEHGSRYVLILTVGKRLWQWRDVAVSIDGEWVSIMVQGRPQIR